MMDSRELGLPSAFLDLLEDWKATVKAWTTALRTVNTQLIELYWAIGQGVRRQQEQEGGGSGVIKRLSEDLRQEFPDMKGLSPETSSRDNFRRDVARQGTSWFLLDKKLGPQAKKAYTAAAVEYGWSRNVLLNMIMNTTLERTGRPRRTLRSRLLRNLAEVCLDSGLGPIVQSALDNLIPLVPGPAGSAALNCPKHFGQFESTGWAGGCRRQRLR
ncbi:DUF1016 N-terminal domain-containing protein [Paenarthrobacter aromaticivorans]|uniref:YhcG N-terminal domain-containing protein n=1 Tax=Paenarthrobacter aromaticivorans TaxID=2849150 RepID=A0ABS6I922_9MICC|nr:DUF1016 N-terminal domain-containing protein [Paenarthrobacter sp. MMS21-TAE1-1]MBU8867887.1 hypothetical protein [Paenarthrobacter sp. MMS21-TAE1-1]